MGWPLPSRKWCVFLWLLGFVLTGLGCALEKPPELIEITEVSPVVWEVGTQLILEGANFPERRDGEVRVQGTIFAPARAARKFSVHWPVRAESRTRAALVLQRHHILELTDGARHVTFRGSLQLEFAPTAPGRPLLYGESEELRFDVFGDESSLPAPFAQEPFAEHLGLQMNESLQVTGVEVGSEAERVGLQVGDRLRVLDGVHLESREDFYPAADVRVSALQYERAGSEGLRTVSLDRSRYQPLAREAAGRALVLFAGVCGALLVVARPGPWLLWWALRRGERGAGAHTLRRGPAFSKREYGVFFFVLFVFWWSLQTPRGGALWDWKWLFLVGFVCLLVDAFLEGGRSWSQRARRFRLGRALVHGCGAVLSLSPLWLAALWAFTEVGASAAAGAAEGQGLLSWFLFSSPGSFLLGVAFLAALVPRAGRRPALPRAAWEPHEQRSGWAWLGLVMCLGVWVVLFAGGAQLQGSASWLRGLLFSLKMVVLTQGLLGVRAELGQLRQVEAGLGWYRAPLVYSGLGVALAWGTWWLSASRAAYAVWLREGLLVFVGSWLLLSALALPLWRKSAGRRVDPWI